MLFRTRVSGQSLNALLGVLGFLVRYAIGFGLCFWFYNVLFLAYICFGSHDFLADLKHCPFFVVFFSVDPTLFGSPPEQPIVSAIIALPIAIIWGRICRRYCRPVREWF